MLIDLASPSVLLAALLLDALIGDPAWLWRRVPHPVALVGALTGALDRRLNRRSESERRWRGVVVALGVTLLAAAAGWAVVAVAHWLPGGFILEMLALFSLIAQRDLHHHVARVVRGLREGGVEGGRAAVAHIVGRDPQTLDAAGVARAALESLAENFSDGVVAPVFWYVVLGLPGVAAYKAINTLDSMIGHRSEHYRAFGWASARIDDVVNWLPARLSGLLMVAGALLVRGTNPREGLAAMRRDAPRHNSPNAGWPEAALAGVLGIALAGPRHYGDHSVDGAWMGRGRAEVTPDDMDAALRVYLWACVATGALAVAICAGA